MLTLQPKMNFKKKMWSISSKINSLYQLIPTIVCWSTWTLTAFSWHHWRTKIRQAHKHSFQESWVRQCKEKFSWASYCGRKENLLSAHQRHCTWKTPQQVSGHSPKTEPRNARQLQREIKTEIKYYYWKHKEANWLHALFFLADWNPCLWESFHFPLALMKVINCSGYISAQILAMKPSTEITSFWDSWLLIFLASSKYYESGSLWKRTEERTGGRNHLNSLNSQMSSENIFFTKTSIFSI